MAGRLPALRGRAAHRGAAPAERGAQLHRVVRAGRALSASRPRAVQLLAADALAAHQPREPAHRATRPGSKSAETWFEEQATGEKPERARARRCSRRSGCAICASRTASSSRRWRNTARSTARPTDWHLVHYAERAKGGAGLVITEMTCVSPEGRITPGCTGLYAPAHEAAWKRIVDFIHAETDAKIAIQLGHSGPKGSTQLGWEAMDAPLAQRQLGGDGAVAGGVVARQPGAARDDARRHGRGARPVRARGARWPSAPASTCWSCTTPTATCCRPSSRRSPTGARDDYGGSLENRMRFPLEVFRAVRAVWPAGKPISVRISANDWVGAEGVTPEDAVAIARMLKAAGVDIIDVSAGQTSHRRRAPSTAACSRRRSPTASATRSASPPWRSATSTSPTTSTRS